MGQVGGGNVRARSRSVRTGPPRWCRGLPPTSLQGRLSPPAFVAGSAAWSLSPPSPPASACRAPVRSSRPDSPEAEAHVVAFSRGARPRLWLPPPACRIPVGDEARGPSPSGSRPGCADGRHPSCRSTQPLHSDPDAGALGCLWRFPARAAHERQLWTDPRRACGGSGREVCTLEVARGAAELAQRNRLSEAFQGAAPVGTPTPARARPETWGSRCLCGKFICS